MRIAGPSIGATVALLLSCAAASGCHGHPSTQPRRGRTSAPAQTAAVPPDDPGRSAASEGPQVGAPHVELDARVDAFGRVIVSVRNRAAQVVRLAPALRLERGGAGGFTPIPDADVPLSENGGSCIELTPGAELIPAWTAAQAKGRYRLIARGCGDAYRIDGAPFELR